MLAGLGVKLVIVLGVTPQIDALLEERGHQPQFLGGYRVTDEHAMLAAMQAAGSARMEVEAQLSKVGCSGLCLQGVNFVHSAWVSCCSAVSRTPAT